MLVSIITGQENYSVAKLIKELVICTGGVPWAGPLFCPGSGVVLAANEVMQGVANGNWLSGE